jgi:hypothetical protein
VDPDGGVVGAGGVGDEDQAIAGVKAVYDVHAPAEDGPIDSAVERIHVWGMGRGDHAAPGRRVTRPKVAAAGAVVKTGGGCRGPFVRAGKSVTPWDFASSDT